jgi:hypothetical protein
VNDPWQAQESEVEASLLGGRSVLFVGGRGVGKTKLVERIVADLEIEQVEVRTALIYEQSPALANPMAVLGPLLGLDPLHEIPSVVYAAQAVQARLNETGDRQLICILDGFQLLAREDWGFGLVDVLRALICETDRIVLGLFGRPSVDALFDGDTSPLSNLCLRRLPAPANRQRVRRHYEALGVGPDIAMRAHRLVGGLPELLPDAVRSIQGGRSDQQAVLDVGIGRADWIAAQFGELSPLAKDLLVVLCDGPASFDGLGVRLSGAPLTRAIHELQAHLLVEVLNGQVSLSSAVHRRWLAEERTARQVASRPRLGARDQEGYQAVSNVEWRAREWMMRRLGDASPDDWWETRIPPESRQRAEARAAQERDAGVVVPSKDLVDYLDFTDIREVIRFRPNWRDLFETVLGPWQGAIEDAMRQIEALRRKVAHSRPLSEEELASLLVAARRVLEILER